MIYVSLSEENANFQLQRQVCYLITVILKVTPTSSAPCINADDLYTEHLCNGRSKHCAQIRGESTIPRFMKHFPWKLFHIKGRKLSAICSTNARWSQENT